MAVSLSGSAQRLKGPGERREERLLGVGSCEMKFLKRKRNKKCEPKLKCLESPRAVKHKVHKMICLPYVGNIHLQPLLTRLTLREENVRE